MLSLLKNWKGAVEINGTEYKSIKDAQISSDLLSNDICIILHTENKNQSESIPAMPNDDSEYVFTVKQYMTRKATEDFDFMLKFNNDIPMPLRTMIGKITNETKGMYYLELRADYTGEIMCNCLKCGKTLNNAVSRYFGMGPECGGHNYVSPFESDEELKEAVNDYRKQLQSITWKGWVIKSAITEMREISNE